MIPGGGSKHIIIPLGPAHDALTTNKYLMQRDPLIKKLQRLLKKSAHRRNKFRGRGTRRRKRRRRRRRSRKKRCKGCCYLF